MAGTRTGVHTLVEVEDGSRTQTIHMHLTPEDNEQEENQEGEPRRVQWAADVIDNEHLNKKSSKICCVYHKPRAFGESSTESGSSDMSDDYETRMRKIRQRRRSHPRCQKST